MKRYSIIILLLVLLLVSCGRKNETNSAQGQGTLGLGAAVWTSEGSAYIEVEEPDMKDASLILTNIDGIYSTSVAPDENGDIKTDLRYNSETIYSPTNALISCVASTDGGVWVLECGFDGEKNISSLKQISTTGKTENEIVLDAFSDFCKDVNTMLCKDNKIYLGNTKQIRTWNVNGEVGKVFSLEGLDSVELICGADGLAYAVCYYQNKTEIKSIGLKKLETVLTLEDKDSLVFGGADAGAFILADGRGLSKLFLDGKLLPIIVWEDCGISPIGIKCLSQISNGEFLYLDNVGVKRLIPTDPSKLSPITELVLATVEGDGGLYSVAADFNRENDRYRVVVKDYSEGGKYDKDTAIRRLNTDIVGGKHPDLLSFTGLSPFSYISKAYLLDLCERIDSTPDLNRQDILILDKLQVDGGVYFMSSSFNIMTLVARYSEFGDRKGWTLEEYLQIEKKLPKGANTMYNTTRENFLRRLSARYLDAGVDWSAGTCDFESEEFYSILEASKRIDENPEEKNLKEAGFIYPSVRVATGALVAVTTWVENIGKLAFEEKMAKSKLSFIGWPSVDGSCGSDIYLSQPLGICAESDNIEGSWEFLKSMLKGANPDDYGKIPVYKPILQTQIERAQKDESFLGIMITEEDTNRFMSLLSEIESIGLYDETILSIIEEEASGYFAGVRGAEEAAKLIQSRVSLYLSERS